ncbi:hypothetical protein Tco_0629059 [Tanacetum coccineum]|uniref:Uncharacterized protein n=1 Tax=Tanacetum coccineum TaxID=301880 RepID=A0ABQ4WS09_9ASTR
MSVVCQDKMAQARFVSAVTELVDLIEPHDHLNPIFILNVTALGESITVKSCLNSKPVASHRGLVSRENLLIFGVEDCSDDLEDLIIRTALRSPSDVGLSM